MGRFDEQYPELARSLERRSFLKAAGAGTFIAALGGTYVLAAEDDPRAKQLRPDGRIRLPPGQRIIDALKPMGGDPGDPNPASFRLQVHGEVDNPLDLDFAALTALPQIEQTCDVHCVTSWSMFDSKWTGVQIAHLAKLAKVRESARYVILEAANGYTANVRVADALAPTSLVAHRYNGAAIPRTHGAPVRGLIPTSTSGRAPSGSPASASWPATSRASGRRAATTTTRTPGKRSDMAEPAVRDAERAEKKGSRIPWRAWLRAIHRDLGNLAVGLTVVYALSGLAVNHIADWEPSFVSYTETRDLGAPLTGSDDAIADLVLARMGVAGPARDVYRAAPDDLQIVLDKRTLHVDAAKGRVTDEGQRPRFFLRVANWLHLNRGKKAWTKVADAYAAGLLFLALSGIFLNPGRKGLFGRGGILVALGAAIPIAYVVLSGGPEHANGTAKPAERGAPAP